MSTLETFATKRNFNPRPPRGGRLKLALLSQASGYISIHAPREGGDRRVGVIGSYAGISIHAPREGGDDAAR